MSGCQECRWTRPDRARVHLVDLSDTVCDETICRVAEGDILTVHDSQHLSATTAHGLIAHWTGSSEQPTRWW